MTTASDPLDPGRVLSEFDLLREAIESAARLEKEAEDARTALVVAARRALRERQEQLEAEMGQRRVELEGRLIQEKQAAEIVHESRLERIQACYRSARQALTEQITVDRDSRVGRVQGEMMRRQEELQDLYEHSKVELTELRAGVEADLEKVAEMTGEGRRLLRGFKPMVSAQLGGRGVQASEAVEGERMKDAESALEVVRGLPMAKFFRFVPLTLLLVLAVGLSVWLSGNPREPGAWWMPAAIAVGGVLVLYVVGLATVLGPSRRLAEALQVVRVNGATEVNAMIERVRGFKTEIESETEALRQGLSETMRESDSLSQDEIRRGREKLEEQLKALPLVAKRLHRRRLDGIKQAHSERLESLNEEGKRMNGELEGELEARTAEADQSSEQALAGVVATWPADVDQRRDRLAALGEERSRRFPDWSSDSVESWQPPEVGESSVPFGTLDVPVAKLTGDRPEDPRFSLPESIEVPLALGFPDHGSLLLEGDAGEAASVVNSIVLRLLGHFPPGRVAFTFIDPVGLGRDFAGLMHLADYEDTLIHGRIWTQPPQIEERLAELNEHVEKVIQMYLRNEYATITEYNESAGSVAEKYQFVVISGLPTGFSESAMARLRSLAASGARCGVYLLIQLEKPLKDAALDAELRKACLCLRQEDGVWRIDGRPGVVALDVAPDDSMETALVHRFGRASVDSNRIEVPFASIAPQGEWWSEKTGNELRVPIGRTGARKLQDLAIGKGTRQHALIAGKTGSGKSTLFHVMITNLALHCSPSEVEFYLVDFKKGVEFKCYGTKRLPHARVVAIESDREFGLSVLHRVDEELRHRGELFREHGVQDVVGYRKATGASLPRTLLMIDEFQEFFTEDDGVGQEASLLLDRIVRQGRAFGIHVILGSQTLGGAYTLARATLGQMVIRIALQCNEADAYLIMDDDNPAPRLLTRPGEGIYNDNAGAVAANSPFQAVWLSEDERNQRLDEVAALAAERGLKMPAPVVFEGNAPADLKENERLASLLADPPSAKPKSGSVWLGAPNSIKGPTEAVFKRQSGSNLLVVGQGEERMKSLMAAALVSLSAQYPAGTARFVLFDPEGDEGDLAVMLGSLSQEAEVYQPGDVAEGMGALAARLEAGGDEEVFVFIRDLQRFKSLRQEEEFGFSFDDPPAGEVAPAKVLLDLIGSGAPAGLHLIAGLDTWNNVGRWIPRKAMADFQLRVLYQMSANDSSALIDSPAAGNLGLMRALLYDEAQGTLETFRPYSRVGVGEMA